LGAPRAANFKNNMLKLLQFPWSPFCIATELILKRHNIPFRRKLVPPHDRAEVIRATQGRGWTVPCIIDGKRAVTDTTDYGQEVARYLDTKFKLGLFPRNKEGLHTILTRYIENDLENFGFKVNDTYVIPTRPLVERVMLIRFKERRYGRGCLQQWTRERAQLNRQFAEALMPLDNILASSPFLLGEKPLFADYSLYGVLGNYLFSGKTKMPNAKNVRRWHAAMAA
jgi:glutathione S-transferase